MVNPSDIVDALVEKLKTVDALVDELGGNPENISAYHYNFSESLTLEEAVDNMPDGSILVRWAGTNPVEVGEGGVYWAHRIEMYLRAATAQNGSVPPRRGMGYLLSQLFSGEPVGGDGMSMLYEEFHPSVEPLHAQIGQCTIEPEEDSQGVSILKVSIPVLERPFA